MLGAPEIAMRNDFWGKIAATGRRTLRRRQMLAAIIVRS
jgi:hypothetical protein